MPIFHYKGYKTDGTQAAGTIEADGLQDALANIKARGVYPKDISALREKGKGWFSSRSDDALLPYLTRQLSTLLSAGVPLIDALRSLSEENTGFWRSVLVAIRENVSAGASLSRALEAHSGLFPDFYISMVSAGEQSGTLDKVLIRVADFLEKQASLRAKLRTAMIYPVFMASVGFIVLSFLFTFVVPKIVRIFENSKSALPFITVVLIAISNLFVHYWWLLIIIAAALALAARRLRQRHGRFLDAMRLKLPGNVLQSLYFGRFARTLGFLIGGGLPMIKSLELSAKATGNVVIEEKIMQAAQGVAEGARLSTSLGGFPPVLLQLISTGEKSGTLVEVLGKAADSYEEDFERRVQRALSLLEPSMILVMGLLVGFIVLAVLLPMFQLNQLVK
ncbi:MAG: type II secretion system F family protein [Nitrospiraceae bacterium]|nr:type II secretion system F family protein [Nitrospiraceae bacterium]